MALMNFYKILKSIYKNNTSISSAVNVPKLKKIVIFLISLILFIAVYTFFSTQVNSYKETKEKNFSSFLHSKIFLNLNEYYLDKINSPYTNQKYKIQNNDSIEKILTRYAVQKDEIKYIVNDFKTKKLSNIYAGKEISIVLKKLENGNNGIINLILPINNTLSIEVRKDGDTFSIKENIIKLIKKEVVIKNIIKNNLYTSAIKAGIEPNIIVEFARIYGFEIDFQRDIRKDDWFEIYYERFIDDNGDVKDTGKIIYASMHVNNRDINLYNFDEKNNNGYFDLNGKSIVKSLMKTPINGARLSSSFGNRKHPILGYTKLHTGTDFAARSGTPIMASGSGTVTRARWCGGGGNCVKIKHNSTYQTVYAHMKNFAKGIKEGRKVRQGQIIGYVGSTGMSTGPHLHYEVIVNRKKVNSQRLRLPSGKVLKGEERKNFEIERIKIDLKLDALRNY